MPFEIVRNDITNMAVDAIVNTANPKSVIGSGTDAGIHAKAGPALLQALIPKEAYYPETPAVSGFILYYWQISAIIEY